MAELTETPEAPSVQIGINGLEAQTKIALSVFSASFILGLLRTGRFTTTHGKYQAAVAQGELETALLPFMPKEEEPPPAPTRAERRRQRSQA